MKKALLALCITAILFAPVTSVAQEQYDVAKITCQELRDESDNEAVIVFMLGWLDGFISAKSNNTMISEEWINKLASHVSGYCEQYPNSTIMDAIRAMRSH